MPSGEKDDDKAIARTMEDSNEGQQQVLAMAQAVAAISVLACVVCLSLPCACPVHLGLPLVTAAATAVAATAAAPTKPTKNMNIWHCFLSDKEVKQDVRDLQATEDHKHKHLNTIARELWARVMAGDANIIA